MPARRGGESSSGPGSTTATSPSPDDVRAGAAVRELRRVLGDHPPQHRRRPARRARRRRRRAAGTRGPVTARPPATRTRADRVAVAEHRLDDGVGARRRRRARAARRPSPGVRARPPRRRSSAPTARPSGSAATCTPSAPSLAISPGTSRISRVTSRCGPPTISGMARHRPVHGVAARRPARRTARASPTQRHDRRRRAAAVDADVATTAPARRASVVDDQPLHAGGPGRGTPAVGHPLMHRRRQHPGVLAAAVLA